MPANAVLNSSSPSGLAFLADTAALTRVVCGSLTASPQAPNASNETTGNENSVRGNARLLRRAGRDGDGPDDLNNHAVTSIAGRLSDPVSPPP